MLRLLLLRWLRLLWAVASGLRLCSLYDSSSVSAQQQAVGKLSRMAAGVRAARTGCTPQMSTPEQFYCDQETDGQRLGHDWPRDWTRSWRCKQLHQNPTERCGAVAGPDAGRHPSAEFADGVRFHRAMNVNGTAWQDFKGACRSFEWSWTLRSTMYWSNISITRVRDSMMVLLPSGEDDEHIFRCDYSDDFRSLHFVEKPSAGL